MDVAVDCFDSPVGPISVAAGEAGLVSVSWGRAEPAGPRDRAQSAVEQLKAYFAGELTEFDLPLDWSIMRGTRLAVLQALSEVPYGEVVTYGELSVRSGTNTPARAVGGIMGSNPLPIVVPCHRVLAADGLGGFSGGDRASGYDSLEVKRWMLILEGAQPPTLDWDPAGLTPSR